MTHCMHFASLSLIFILAIELLSWCMYFLLILLYLFPIRCFHVPLPKPIQHHVVQTSPIVKENLLVFSQITLFDDLVYFHLSSYQCRWYGNLCLLERESRLDVKKCVFYHLHERKLRIKYTA